MTTRSTDLLPTGELQKRVKHALGLLRSCELCPRRCRVDRLAGGRGVCETGRYAAVAEYGPHFGEEQPLVGTSGSGTIFFASCNLHCCFCQNHDISSGTAQASSVDRYALAGIMIELQDRGCHNINLVTPSHVLPQIIEAIPPAIEQGLKIPLVYNCSGYESPAALALLDGVVDIYLTDFKFWEPSRAANYCGAADYPEYARRSLQIMHRQVGDLSLDVQGIAESGLLVRHLLMPRGLADANAIFTFIAKEISSSTYLNIMDQYHPCGTWHEHEELGESIGAEHYRQAVDFARQAGLHRIDRRDLGSLLRSLGLV